MKKVWTMETSERVGAGGFADLARMCVQSGLGTWKLGAYPLLPVVQGGMGVGISAGGLAGAVAAPGANLLQPALTLWFDLPASVAAARLASARVPDKFEAQPQAFFEAVASGYARRLAEQPQRFARVDADQPLQAVRAQVLAALRETGFLA